MRIKLARQSSAARRGRGARSLSAVRWGDGLKAWVTPIVALAFAACLVMSACADSGLSERITATVEKGAGTKLVMADLTDFDWQRLYIFAPYTTQKQIDRSLGFEWPDPEGIELHDTFTLLAFVNDGEVVSYVAQPLGQGDFADLSEGSPWTPDSAVFVVADDREAGLGQEWFVLRQALP